MNVLCASIHLIAFISVLSLYLAYHQQPSRTKQTHVQTSKRGKYQLWRLHVYSSWSDIQHLSHWSRSRFCRHSPAHHRQLPNTFCLVSLLTLCPFSLYRSPRKHHCVHAVFTCCPAGTTVPLYEDSRWNISLSQQNILYLGISYVEESNYWNR